MRAQRANAIIQVALGVRPKRLMRERRARRRLGVNSIANEDLLETVHGVDHPLLPLRVEQIALVGELLAEMLAVANGVAAGPAVVARLEAGGVERTFIEWGIGALRRG